ncbi:MAG: LLM class flavin-dependent oxidoreductase [Chloroflexota bacterium]|nr:LLM class flavin-dependent oxidoreductase [Chloroflexota bacterium]
MAASRPVRGFGVAADVPLEMIRELAAATEAAGYRTFWVNNPANGDGLAILKAAAEVTATIRLGVGVIPLEHVPPDQILERLLAHRLPQERVTLGIGSGRRPGAISRVRQAGEQLRAETATTVVVGALGPQMLRVAGEAADGVLLNWLTANYVVTAAEQTIRAAAAADRPRPRIDAYVRCALGPDALTRLQAEGERYTAIPQYGAHFTRMRVRAVDTAVVGLAPDAIQRGLAEFDGKLDEVVLRAIVAEETLANYRALLEAGAP